MPREIHGVVENSQDFNKAFATRIDAENHQVPAVRSMPRDMERFQSGQNFRPVSDTRKIRSLLKLAYRSENCLPVRESLLRAEAVARPFHYLDQILCGLRAEPGPPLCT
ncbi:MAG TPA: hypothetical protein VHW02_02805 [Rhizomicrobium sp.]|nr:hypothetical protein [Rhizomicrobium sp.]